MNPQSTSDTTACIYERILTIAARTSREAVTGAEKNEALDYLRQAICTAPGEPRRRLKLLKLAYRVLCEAEWRSRSATGNWAA